MRQWHLNFLSLVSYFKRNFIPAAVPVLIIKLNLPLSQNLPEKVMAKKIELFFLSLCHFKDNGNIFFLNFSYTRHGLC